MFCGISQEVPMMWLSAALRGARGGFGAPFQKRGLLILGVHQTL